MRSLEFYKTKVPPFIEQLNGHSTSITRVILAVPMNFGCHPELWIFRICRAQQERESGENWPDKSVYASLIHEGYFLVGNIPQCRSALVFW
jgi:hypothetical protein